MFRRRNRPAWSRSCALGLREVWLAMTLKPLAGSLPGQAGERRVPRPSAHVWDASSNFAVSSSLSSSCVDARMDLLEKLLINMEVFL